MEKAHKTVVHQYLQKARVEERLSKYKFIGKTYNFDNLMKCLEKPPYYCHYFAWRLGVWEGEEWFKFFDGLLENADSLKGWNNGKSKKSFIEDCGFDKFWQLLWELQVAKFFVDEGLQVEWLTTSEPSPDLKIKSRYVDFYVECTNYTKSFGTMSFIEDLCDSINQRIKVHHTPFRSLGLGKYQESPDKLDSLLDRIFRPILELKDHPPMPDESRVLFSDPEVDNFIIYLEGTGLHAEPPPGMIAANMAQGDSVDTLQVAIKEAINMKIDKKTGNLKNGLSSYHPHLVAINLLLSRDTQVEIFIQKYFGKEIELSPGIWADYNKFDKILLTHCGINELPSISRFHKVQPQRRPS